MTFPLKKWQLCWGGGGAAQASQNRTIIENPHRAIRLRKPGADLQVETSVEKDICAEHFWSGLDSTTQVVPTGHTRAYARPGTSPRAFERVLRSLSLWGCTLETIV